MATAKNKSAGITCLRHHVGPCTAERLRRLPHKAREKARLGHIRLCCATRHGIASRAVNAGAGCVVESNALDHGFADGCQSGCHFISCTSGRRNLPFTSPPRSARAQIHSRQAPAPPTSRPFRSPRPGTSRRSRALCLRRSRRRSAYHRC